MSNDQVVEKDGDLQASFPELDGQIGLEEEGNGQVLEEDKVVAKNLV